MRFYRLWVRKIDQTLIYNVLEVGQGLDSGAGTIALKNLNALVYPSLYWLARFAIENCKKCYSRFGQDREFAWQQLQK